MIPIILAVSGFCGFEGLRIYKASVEKRQNPIPKMKFLYVITILWLSFFAGIVVWALGIENKPLALYVGFSLPCSLRAFLKTQLPGVVDSEDIEVERSTQNTVASSGPQDVRKSNRYIHWLAAYLDA